MSGRVIAIAMMLASCAMPQVPTERLPITWVPGRHGYYEKGGVVVDGWSCGEQYRRAVAGVPDAEAAIDRCGRRVTWYAVLMSTFVVAPLSGLAASRFVSGRYSDRVLEIGGLIGLAGFALGIIVGVGSDDLRDAVRLYNNHTR